MTSDSIADALESDDVCTAAHRADELKEQVIEAINAGEVPPRFQEELLGRANELVNAVNCPEPPAQEEPEPPADDEPEPPEQAPTPAETQQDDAPATEPQPEDDGKPGKDKKKDKKKEKRKRK